MPIISCMPEEAPAHLAAAPGVCSYCAPLDQHPKLSQYWPFWTAWGWFLDPVPMENLLFSFPSPWKGSAGWCAPNLPVLGSLLPSPCAPGGGWPQCHLAMAQPGEPGLWSCPHKALCGCKGRAGDAGLGTARVTGDKGGDVRVLSCQGCQAPACPHHRGLKGSHVMSYSRGSCLVPRAQLALPSSPHFPRDQLSRNSFCLESSQVFFLFQSCSNCPKAPGS